MKPIEIRVCTFKEYEDGVVIGVGFYHTHPRTGAWLKVDAQLVEGTDRTESGWNIEGLAHAMVMEGMTTEDVFLRHLRDVHGGDTITSRVVQPMGELPVHGVEVTCVRGDGTYKVLRAIVPNYDDARVLYERIHQTTVALAAEAERYD